jgi:nucleotide-binding universal stress UspA family protein
MTSLLAAIDNDLAARPVLETARRLGVVLHVPVKVLHVVEDGFETGHALADAAAIPVTYVQGESVPAIIRAFSAEDVVMGVLGLRGAPAGRRPAGSTALSVAQSISTPLVVVPPDVDLFRPEDRLRVLIPLDGTEQTAAAAQEATRLFAAANVDVVALHVFSSANVPKFWDQPHHAMESWGREFANRQLDQLETHVELRTGVPGARVVDVAADAHADLIVLSWSQDLSAERAQTVREVLARSRVPVVLLPVTGTAGDDADPTPARTVAARADPG